MMHEVRERTGGRILMGAGTLYGALKRMAQRGLIEEIEDHRPSDGSQNNRRRY